MTTPIRYYSHYGIRCKCLHYADIRTKERVLCLTYSALYRYTGGWMAIYRTLYYTDVSVGVGGRVTIPQNMREDLGIDEGNSLTVRVEENPKGGRQMVVWRAEQQPDDQD